MTCFLLAFVYNIASLKGGGVEVENSVNLPTGHKFTLYRDVEDVYVLESQQEGGLIVDGLSPNEVVAGMIEIMPKWRTMDELSRGYTANVAHALKLYKEFEGAITEVLSRLEPYPWPEEFEAGK